jgi:hypothetical protein
VVRRGSSVNTAMKTSTQRLFQSLGIYPQADCRPLLPRANVIAAATSKVTATNQRNHEIMRYIRAQQLALIQNSSEPSPSLLQNESLEHYSKLVFALLENPDLCATLITHDPAVASVLAGAATGDPSQGGLRLIKIAESIMKLKLTIEAQPAAPEETNDQTLKAVDIALDALMKGIGRRPEVWQFLVRLWQPWLPMPIDTIPAAAHGGLHFLVSQAFF